MDLKVATDEDIKNEMNRRRMVFHNEMIRKHVDAINIAYNTGKITSIDVTVDNAGTSAAVKTYYVRM